MPANIDIDNIVIGKGKTRPATRFVDNFICDRTKGPSVDAIDQHRGRINLSKQGLIVDTELTIYFGAICITYAHYIDSSHAEKKFGFYESATEHGNVVWHFSPRSAQHDRRFAFHPTQKIEEEADGSLLVRFRASGHIEMCWHL